MTHSLINQPIHQRTHAPYYHCPLNFKICDFGWPVISRQLYQHDGQEWDLHLIGTPGYIPPEVLRFHSSTKVGEAVPEEHYYDPKKWDSFSCGMVCFQNSKCTLHSTYANPPRSLQPPSLTRFALT